MNLLKIIKTILLDIVNTIYPIKFVKVSIFILYFSLSKSLGIKSIKIDINNNINNHNIPSPVQFTYFLVVLSRASSPIYTENPRIIEPIVSKYKFKITDVPAIIERGLVFMFWKLFTLQS